ncbi:MAG: PAS domain S-box protein [Acidobacteria bacterium]|nr:PAS domain S-box protein [Acidobacteriota bacterium]
MTDTTGQPDDAAPTADAGPSGDSRPAPAPSTNELEHIRYALDQAAIVATTDVQGRISYANDKFCQISGYGRDELLGQDHRILNSGYHSPAFIRDLWQTIARGQVWRGELRNRAKSGSYYWVDTTIVPFLDDRGKPWQYMAIRYDITERKRNEERLREQATLASLGEMAAVVAHEVRNPLAGIRGGVQVLASYLPPHAIDAHEFIREIVTRIDSLNAAISDLLEFARLREPKLVPIDVAVLLSDVVKSLRYDPGLEGIAWQVETACSPASVKADVDQLRLLFTNLAINAAQSAGASGHVWLTARPDGQRCIVEVSDDGPGVPPAVRDRVFEPFFTTKHRGTGLGLPTAKRIVEAHGGEISLVERPGRGTTARVVLTLQDQVA